MAVICNLDLLGWGAYLGGGLPLQGPVADQESLGRGWDTASSH